MTEIADFDRFYHDDEKESKKAEKLISENEKEVDFYGNDLEFMRHHKRTK